MVFLLPFMKSCIKRPAKITQIALIVSMLLMVVIYNAQAQSYNEEYHLPTAGLLAGLSISQVDGDGYKGYNKAGITGGGVLFVPFGDMDMPVDGTIALSMEVLFSQKGSRGVSPIPGAGVLSQKINLQYAEVPLQLNFYRGARKSGFGAGFGIGYLATAEELVDRGGGQVIKNGLPFRKFDFSFVLTGNIHLWRGFFLSPRFQYSMLSVRNNNGMYGGRNEQFNNVVSFRLMYLFRRGNGY